MYLGLGTSAQVIAYLDTHLLKVLRTCDATDSL